ncbi:hypothetical protein HYALB_00003152 [Hymenoscyphus albidus]|uniref:Uncharacterized protein n=1 Tax=Hymenoscyphus albidus TaxID=595503 RepID=A0A9N9Q1H2_9HELO|nr:hypothetical protein HYALB_00003152 [Hymenoscyphus albidus]
MVNSSTQGASGQKVAPPDEGKSKNPTSNPSKSSGNKTNEGSSNQKVTPSDEAKNKESSPKSSNDKTNEGAGTKKVSPPVEGKSKQSTSNPSKIAGDQANKGSDDKNSPQRNFSLGEICMCDMLSAPYGGRREWQEAKIISEPDKLQSNFSKYRIEFLTGSKKGEQDTVESWRLKHKRAETETKAVADEK